MIDKTLIPVGGLKKEPFSGEHHGMRYYFCADSDKTSFSVYIYPDPWTFEKTPDKDKQHASFPMSEEGMDSAINWLLKKYEEGKEEWCAAYDNRMHIL